MNSIRSHFLLLWFLLNSHHFWFFLLYKLLSMNSIGPHFLFLRRLLLYSHGFWFFLLNELLPMNTIRPHFLLLRRLLLNCHSIWFFLLNKLLTMDSIGSHFLFLRFLLLYIDYYIRFLLLDKRLAIYSTRSYLNFLLVTIFLHSRFLCELWFLWLYISCCLRFSRWRSTNWLFFSLLW